MSEYQDILDEWRKAAFKQEHDKRLALVKAAREKREEEQKKRYDDPNKPKIIKTKITKEWLPPHRRKPRKSY